MTVGATLWSLVTCCVHVLPNSPVPNQHHLGLALLWLEGCNMLKNKLAKLDHWLLLSNLQQSEKIGSLGTCLDSQDR